VEQSLVEKLTATQTVPALGSTQPPIQWEPRVLSLRAKRSGREADHSLQSSAEVKEWVELYLHSVNMLSWCGAQFKKSTGKLYLYLLIVNKFLDFIESENLLPSSQQPTTGPCHEPDESSSHPPELFKIHSNILCFHLCA
jgi:hypothetical protein